MRSKALPSNHFLNLKDSDLSSFQAAKMLSFLSLISFVLAFRERS